jgi:hypothetical protein
MCTKVGLVRGCSASVVRRWVANLSLACSSATAADSSPAFRKNIAVGVVLHAGRMPLAAIASVLSIAAMCHPMYALTSCGLPGLSVCGCLVRPLYQHSVPYRSGGYTQAIVALRRELAGGL